jgi:hypothetical protein
LKRASELKLKLERPKVSERPGPWKISSGKLIAKITAEEYDARGTMIHKGSGTEVPGHDSDGVRTSQHLGTTATVVSQWWSDRSETPTDDGRNDAYNSDDERYFSDHFIEELWSTSNSVASDPPRPRSPLSTAKSTRELAVRLASFMTLTVRRASRALSS